MIFLTFHIISKICFLRVLVISIRYWPLNCLWARISDILLRRWCLCFKKILQSCLCEFTSQIKNDHQYWGWQIDQWPLAAVTLLMFSSLQGSQCTSLHNSWQPLLYTPYSILAPSWYPDFLSSFCYYQMIQHFICTLRFAFSFSFLLFVLKSPLGNKIRII